jgi:hypothetical protein
VPVSEPLQAVKRAAKKRSEAAVGARFRRVLA